MTWADATEGTSTTFFVDPNFKYIDGNGGLIDANGATEDIVVPLQYSDMLGDEHTHCPGLITTDALFLLRPIIWK